MTERLRQHYLQALGIESYVPRWVLPGAAASKLCEFETHVDEGSIAANTAEVTVAAATAGVADTAQAKEKVNKKSEAKIALPEGLIGDAKKGRAAQRPATVTPARVAEHRFVLSAWRIAEDVMVLNSRQAELALPVEQLLLNMSRSLGFDLATLPRGELLRWPLLDSSAPSPAGIVQSVEDARAMVQAYLNAQHEKQGIGTVLLMGGDAARHGLSARDFDSDREAGTGDQSAKGLAGLLGKSFPLPSVEQASAGERSDEGSDRGHAVTQAIVLPSLAAMLQRPSLKVLTWKAIKHLRVSR